MKISEIRKSVIDKLESEIRNLAVEPFPNNPKEYALTHHRGAVLIAFDGLNFTIPDMIQQVYSLSLTATVLFQSSLDSGEMLDELDRIRQSITNELYIYGSRFYCVNQVPLGEEDNIWYYKIKFILPGVTIQGD